jgi:hypothetical protein
LTDPGLGNNNSYGQEMNDAKPETVHPVPAAIVACIDQYQTTNNKDNDREVKQ